MENNKSEYKEIEKFLLDYVRDIKRNSCKGSFIQYLQRKNVPITISMSLRLHKFDLSGVYEEIARKKLFRVTDFNGVDLARSELIEANCFLTTFNGADLNEVNIRDTKYLNPARFYLAKNIDTIIPDEDKQANAIKDSAWNLYNLNNDIQEDNTKKDLNKAIEEYKMAFDLGAHKDIYLEHLIESQEDLINFTYDIDKLLNQPSELYEEKMAESAMPKDALIFLSSLHIKKQIEKLITLVEVEKESNSPKRFSMEILGITLSAARSLKDDDLQKKIIAQMVQFFLNNFLKLYKKHSQIEKNLKEFFESIPVELFELRKQISLIEFNENEIDTLKKIKDICQMICDSYGKIIERIFNCAIEILDKGDTPKFEIIAVGSLATRLITLTSDINFFPIVEDKNFPSKYFDSLYELIELMIIGVGETPCIEARAVINHFKLSDYQVQNGGFHIALKNLFKFIGNVHTPEMIINKFVCETSIEHRKWINSLLITKQIFNSSNALDSLYQQFQIAQQSFFIDTTKFLQMTKTMLLYFNEQYQRFSRKRFNVQKKTKFLFLYLTENIKLMILLLYSNQKKSEDLLKEDFFDWIFKLEPHISKPLYNDCIKLFNLLIMPRLNLRVPSNDLSEMAVDKVLSEVNKTIWKLYSEVCQTLEDSIKRRQESLLEEQSTSPQSVDTTGKRESTSNYVAHKLNFGLTPSVVNAMNIDLTHLMVEIMKNFLKSTTEAEQLNSTDIEKYTMDKTLETFELAKDKESIQEEKLLRDSLIRCSKQENNFTGREINIFEASESNSEPPQNNLEKQPILNEHKQQVSPILARSMNETLSAFQNLQHHDSPVAPVEKTDNSLNLFSRGRV